MQTMTDPDDDPDSQAWFDREYLKMSAERAIEQQQRALRRLRLRERLRSMEPADAIEALLEELSRKP